jgi:membrane fusion protein (multidrug efflux system)
MGIVPLSDVYVTADYKETQFTHVHPGQKVTIDVDTFPGTVVHGVVNSTRPGQR